MLLKFKVNFEVRKPTHNKIRTTIQLKLPSPFHIKQPDPFL